MELRSKRRALFISAIALVLVLLFQNMSFVEFVALGVAPIDEDARQQQAQELLGTYYPYSLARETEYHPYMNYFLLNEIQRSLGKRYKAYVPSLTDTIIRQSREYGFDPIFVVAIIKTESTFNPNARGTSGEIGLMQLRPQTAKWVAEKFKMKWKGEAGLYDPIYNVKLGIRYFSLLRSKFRQSAYHYIPAYNMGPTNVRRLHQGDDLKQFEFAYSKKVMQYYRSTYRRMAKHQREFEAKYANN